MKRLFKFRYPKLFALISFSIISYLIFSNEYMRNFFLGFTSSSYFWIFIAGLLFPFGFSTPFAIGFFLTIKPENIFLATCVGGFGALFSDLFIFKMIRFSFMDEFKRLEKTKSIKRINRALSSKFLHRVKNYLLFTFAVIVIASPLPNELGVSMLAGLTKINSYVLGVISFIMNSLGIFIMLSIGNAII